MSCLFCKIVAAEIPSSIIAENGDYMAYMDIFPASQGHVLVIPKQHSETILEMSDEHLSGMMRFAQSLVPAIMKAVEAVGFNYHVNSGVVAGQVVPHTHLHIIPRFSDTQPILTWEAGSPSQAELEDIFGRIKSCLASGT